MAKSNGSQSIGGGNCAGVQLASTSVIGPSGGAVVVGGVVVGGVVVGGVVVGGVVVGGVVVGGVGQPMATRLMANNSARGINNTFFFTCFSSFDISDCP